MLRKLRERIQTEERGFTLIELLVVVLIIGILAAIAIPSFLSQTDKADDASAKSAARNAQTAAETYRVDQGGTYAGLDAADLVAIEATLADAVNLAAAPNAGNDGYTVSADGEDTGTTFTITRAAGGTVTRTCDAPGTGGCTDQGGTGVW